MKDALDKFIASNEDEKKDKGEAEGSKKGSEEKKPDFDYQKIEEATAEMKLLTDAVHKMMLNKKKSETSDKQPLVGLVGNYFSRASATFKNDPMPGAILETLAKEEEDEVFETIEVEDKVRAYSSVPMQLRKAVKQPG